MNVQHFLTSKHLAAEKGYQLTDPERTDLGWEVCAVKDGKTPFAGFAPTPERAVQLCLNML